MKTKLANVIFEKLVMLKNSVYVIMKIKFMSLEYKNKRFNL